LPYRRRPISADRKDRPCSRARGIRCPYLVIGATVFTVAIFAIDSFGAHPSSTAGLIFLVVPIYTTVVVGAIVAADWPSEASSTAVAARRPTPSRRPPHSCPSARNRSRPSPGPASGNVT
jgi:hypothetical protein